MLNICKKFNWATGLVDKDVAMELPETNLLKFKINTRTDEVNLKKMFIK